MNKDYSKENPALHRLYVTTAMQHLLAFKKSIKRLSRSNINWSDAVRALHVEREKLIKNDTAYQEATWRLLIGQRVRDVFRDGEKSGYEIFNRYTDEVIPEPPSGIFRGKEIIDDNYGAMGLNPGESNMRVTSKKSSIDTRPKRSRTRPRNKPLIGL